MAQFLRWKDRFLVGGSKALGESSKGNEYQKEIDDLKRLVGDQALVIDTLKKDRREEIMLAVNDLKKDLPVSRISRTMDIPRSSICYRSDATGSRKSRISKETEDQILKIAADRTTYGYRRIWAMLRNSGTHVNINTVRRIMRKHSLALPYANAKIIQEEGVPQNLIT